MVVLVVGPLVWVALGALQLLGWQRVRTGRLVSEDEEHLRQLRRQLEQSRSVSFGYLLAGLLSAAGVVLLATRDLLGAVFLVEALLLLAVYRQVQLLRPKALAALGDRGRQRRTDRYLRRARLARGFFAAFVVVYTTRFVLGAFSTGPAGDGIEVARDVLNVVNFLAVVGSLVVYAMIFISGDNLAEPDDDEVTAPHRD